MSRINKIANLFKVAQECECDISYHNEEEYDEDYDFDDILSQAAKLFDNSGIRMMYKDDFYSFCINASGEVLGCLVYHQDSIFEDDYAYPVYYFSIVTSNKCNKKGIATRLISDFVDGHKNNSIIKSETYNRGLDSLLERMGFIEFDKQVSNNYQSIKFHALIPNNIKDYYLQEQLIK
jgi:hypothetical protein